MAAASTISSVGGDVVGRFRLSYTPVKALLEEGELMVKSGVESTAKGHIRSVRVYPNVTFIELYDGSTAASLQLVLDHKTSGDLRVRVAKHLNIAATISARGKLMLSGGKGQKYEFQVSDLQVVGPIKDPSTFLPSLPGVALDTWRQHADLRPHSKTIQSIFRIRSALMRLIQHFFDKHRFHRLDPNTITSADCEGAGENFIVTTFDSIQSIPITSSDSKSPLLKMPPLKMPVPKKLLLPEPLNGEFDGDGTRIDWTRDFFGSDEPARLTVSSQLQLEALCHAMGACWTANPSYRAEKSKTRRHVASFTHVEYEIPFIELKDLMDFGEDLVQECCTKVLAECADDLKFLDGSSAPGLIEKLRGFVKQSFARITYDEAIQVLEKHKDDVLKKFEGDLSALPQWGDDLGGYCERFLAEEIFKRPTFVFNYPRSLKSFYMLQNQTPTITQSSTKTVDRTTVQGCDLLVPGLGELIGSSIREHDYDRLQAEVARRMMDPKPLQWYLNLRKNASVPTGGAGLGFDRFVQVMCTTTLGNIRDTIPFPVAYQECQF
jgi:asparaginyl-tRNA synthetase